MSGDGQKRSFEPGELLLLRGIKFAVVIVEEDWVTLRDMNSGAVRSVPIGQVDRPSRSSVSSEPGRLRLSASLPELNPPDLDLHMRELVTGQQLSGAIEPRPQYRPELPAGVRERSKLDELDRLGAPMTLRSLQNKKRSWKIGGPAALVDGRKLRAQDPLGRVHPKVRQAILETIDDSIFTSTGSLDAFIARTRDHLEVLDPDFRSRFPSRSAMRNYLKMLGNGKHTLGKATTRQSAANQPKGLNRTRVELFPGSAVQIDSSGFDIMVRDYKGRAHAAQLTVMIDIPTRLIIGSCLRIVAMKAIDHVHLLARALLPPESRPVDRELTELLSKDVWPAVFGSELDVALLPAPYVRPHVLVTDHGADYVSREFVSACDRFGVTRIEAASYTPTDKPNVERLFRYIETGFAQYIPGFTGGSPENRGRNVEKQELLSIEQLARLFDVWCTYIYANRRHASLRDPLYPSIMHSPNTLYQAMRRFTSDEPLQPITSDGYISLMSPDYRTIGRLGVSFRNRRYDSRELDPYRGMPSNWAGAGRRWPIRFDPYNYGQVWVEKPNHDWIACKLVDRSHLDQPFGKAIEDWARLYDQGSISVTNEEAHAVTSGLVKGHQQRKREESHSARNDAARQRESELGAHLAISAEPSRSYDLAAIEPMEIELDEEDTP
ncbi:Mu transposase C-terminal domain-containing protein [Salinibacterium sp. ZJ450]|uniref:Mu transposase C-terminal domain-containing protein n=1 Tax=Salinibacterium sp. ZJ450 TaxID=2708338 RepID=UPI00141FFCEE|nr:Mu transposase C-terminal domain-containing protein [Salinibacterium sp. ZJ450]